MRVRGFGELEAVIMNRLWDRTEATTVRDIFEQFTDSRRIAYTTVMSTMDNLHRKGCLARARVGKAYRYWPTMTREEHSASLMRDALDGGGDAGLVLTFFLDQLDADTSAQVQAALRRLSKNRRKP